jgi:hypothetical protein
MIKGRPRTEMSEDRPEEFLARRLIEEHMLRAGDRVTGARIQGPAVVVTTSRWNWLVEPRSRPPTTIASMRLFEVSMDIVEDPPSPSRGFAIGSGLPALDLGVPADLTALWRRADGQVRLREFAELLVDYQPGELVSSIIRDPADVRSLVPPESVRGLAGYTEPVESSTASADQIAFCTYAVDADEADREVIVVERWEVRVAHGGVPSWERRPLGSLSDET